MKKSLALLLTALMLMLSLAVPVVATDAAYAEPVAYAQEAVDDDDCQPMHWFPTMLMYVIGVPLALLMAPFYWLFLYIYGVTDLGANWFTHIFVAGWESFAMQIRWIGSVRNWMSNC